MGIKGGPKRPNNTMNTKTLIRLRTDTHTRKRPTAVGERSTNGQPTKDAASKAKRQNSQGALKSAMGRSNRPNSAQVGKATLKSAEGIVQIDQRSAQIGRSALKTAKRRSNQPKELSKSVRITPKTATKRSSRQKGAQIGRRKSSKSARGAPKTA
jgi:hypothetical protein